MASAQSPMQLTKHQYDDRAEFIEQLAKLIKEEYHEIYRILKRNNEPYTENANGILFNVNEISQNSFEKMKTFIDFCFENRNEEDRRLKELEDLRKEATILSNITT
jgi:tRNA isopentenyl-2-thiomethyl-A-37 hydroxylase MiaE